MGKWSVAEYVLKAKPEDFVNGMNVGVRMKGVMDDLQALGLSNWEDRVADLSRGGRLV